MLDKKQWTENQGPCYKEFISYDKKDINKKIFYKIQYNQIEANETSNQER